ncbi:MAG: hypothetical protein RL065_1230, partial [Bacteroidota bacterium]
MALNNTDYVFNIVLPEEIKKFQSFVLFSKCIGIYHVATPK